MDFRNSWLAGGEVHFDPFVTVNLAFMVLDIFLAHPSNQFRDQAEFIPLWFSVFGPPVPVTGLGHLVGWISVLVGLAGVMGLGLLLIMNRMVPSRSVEWAQRLIALSVGGFAGNNVLCLTDHTVNGFYRPEEWISVISAAEVTEL